MITENIFWRIIAGTLGILLAISIVVNSVWEEAIPYQYTLLLFGSLIAIGIGNSIINPSTSPVILSEQKEAQFRQKQYVIGFVVSSILVLMLVMTDLRESTLAWLFVPIIVLPFVLIIRNFIKKV